MGEQHEKAPARGGGRALDGRRAGTENSRRCRRVGRRLIGRAKHLGQVGGIRPVKSQELQQKTGAVGTRLGGGNGPLRHADGSCDLGLPQVASFSPTLKGSAHPYGISHTDYLHHQ